MRTISFNPTVQLDGNDYFQLRQEPVRHGLHRGRSVHRRQEQRAVDAINGFPYDFGSSSRGSHYTHTSGGGRSTTDSARPIGWPGIRRPARSRTPKAGVTAITGPLFATQDYHLYSGHSAAGDWGVSVDGIARAPTTTNTPTFALTASNELVGSQRHSRLHRRCRGSHPLQPHACRPSSAKRSIRISRPSTASRSATAIARRTTRPSTGT